ncbi:MULTISPECIES: DUF1269 domain-containing protein [Halomonas]|uniref:DUF1269 domain-containing protein n=1 Tax=Halomonas flagellata TaxID=2920385 RepID=A0ABS9RYS2_9GAMM|nr:MULTISPECIES: DUF1269 domain-containing protein [Halomonas]MCH4565003.1 DUF1269 domain-containing protein [Halomonas flagellata]PXX95577.1 DUF1269 domain-containing protein [Halomonas sp. LBP4]
MSRLYFLTPDLDTTVNIAHELNDLKLKKHEVHVTGRDWKLLEKQGVHNATLRETTDVVNAAMRGLKYGVPLGLVLGIIAYVVLDRAIDGVSFILLILGMAVFGGLFGIWSSTMIGVSVHDVKVDKFEDDIENGAFLMMVDVPADREDEIYTAIHRHHPDVVIDKVTRDELRHHWGAGR